MKNEIETKSVVATVNKVQNVYSIMKKGSDYGVVPGCGNKPVLMKSGAEKLLLAFGLYAQVETAKTDLEGNNREYDVKVSLISRKTGEKVGEGVGLATTLEKKFKRDNPPDMFNTVLKMAKKRAMVDACLSSLAASSLFTQDVIEVETEAEDFDLVAEEEALKAYNENKNTEGK